MNSYIPRAIEESIVNKLQPNKVIVLLGARRVGKTLLLNHLIEHSIHEPFLFFNGEDMAVQALLSQRTAENYKRLLGDKKLLILDEAQKLEDVGQILKFMVDTIEGLKVIATGSSVFDLSNKLGEPLTGRKYTFKIFPLAQMEFSAIENSVQTMAKLEERLIYGCYPELVHLPSNQEKADYLNEMVDAYLLKDILEFDGIRNAAKMLDLLRLIAFQMGKEVSLEELGRQLSLSRNTVEKYLDLLSKVFVVYKLSGFSRNLRSEITKTNRWYFYDNGIRNALIRNYHPLSIRNDAGELWENYVLTERVKFQHYTKIKASNYFWRTYEQQEINWIEESGGKLTAYELKWNPAKTVRAPTAWTSAYPESSFQIIHPDNYLDWITSIEEF